MTEPDSNAEIAPDVLFVTGGIASTRNSALALAKRLNQQSMTCAFVGPGIDRDAVVANGWQFRELVDDVRSRQGLREVRATRPLLLPREAWKRRRRLDELDELRSIFGANRNAVVVLDAEMHVAQIAARAVGMRSVVLMPWCSVRRRLMLPPLHTDLDVAETWSERLQNHVAWAKLHCARATAGLIRRVRPKSIVRRAFVPMNYRTVDRRTLVRVMRRHGQRPGKLTSPWHWLAPHLVQDMPLMHSVLAEFDVPEQAAPGEFFVGPLVDPDRAEPAMSIDDKTRWQEAQAHLQPDGRLVYCSFGTRSDRASTIGRKLAQAFADRPETVVISAGSSMLLGDVPSNVFVLGYAPQPEVLRRADVAVIHGGIGTINECIVAATPMVIDRFGAVDQPGCALRVERCGLGERVDLAALDPADVVALITRVAEASPIETALQRYQVLAQQAERAGLAEKVIEDLRARPLDEGQDLPTSRLARLRRRWAISADHANATFDPP